MKKFGLISNQPADLDSNDYIIYHIHIKVKKHIICHKMH